jgi:hypothetical protein
MLQTRITCAHTFHLQALYLGAVPVVAAAGIGSSVDAALLEGLPAIIVPTWQGLTTMALMKRYEDVQADMAAGKYNPERLRLSHYVCRILAVAKWPIPSEAAAARGCRPVDDVGVAGGP